MSVLLTPLRDADSRLMIFRRLAAEYRATVWLLEGQTTKHFAATTLKNYVPLYHSPTAIKALYEQFPQFTPTDFKKAILGRPRDPGDFLQSASIKIAELHENPLYEDVTFGVLKRAVFFHSSNPEGYLNNAIAVADQLLVDPLYEDFDDRSLRYVAFHYTKTPHHTILDQAIKKAERLRRNTRYASLPLSIVRRAAIMTPKGAEAALDKIIDATVQLRSNPRYDVFSHAHIVQAAADHPVDTVGFLDYVLSRYHTFRTTPRYAKIADEYIRTEIFNHAEPKPFLDHAAKKIDELLANPRYAEFGIGYIADAILKRSETPENYFEGIIAKIETYEADPTFAGLARETIRLALIRTPNEADAKLRQMAIRQSNIQDEH